MSLRNPTNDELLKSCYADTHRAADLVSDLENIARDDVVLAQDALPKLVDLHRTLQTACGAALALSQRAKGNVPPRQG
jgi:hypothetical protein